MTAAQYPIELIDVVRTPAQLLAANLTSYKVLYVPSNSESAAAAGGAWVQGHREGERSAAEGLREGWRALCVLLHMCGSGLSAQMQHAHHAIRTYLSRSWPTCGL